MRIVYYTGTFFLILSFNNSKIQLTVKLLADEERRCFSIEFYDIKALINKINVAFNYRTNCAFHNYTRVFF
ncbi:MAG: hypothetical protein JWR09_3410 [Mucilaginibacter sp.]|nr:hypothetical protein [Mucilaginibacter sp.]